MDVHLPQAQWHLRRSIVGHLPCASEASNRESVCMSYLPRQLAIRSGRKEHE